MQPTQIIKELFSRAGIELSEVKEQREGGRIKLDIKVEDARMLIGGQGATLNAIQHIVRRIAEKNMPPPDEGVFGFSPGYKGVDFLESGSLPSFGGGSARRSPLIDLDINGYKKMREDILRDFAMDIAQGVRRKKRAMELKPMPSFDRRIIHLTLSGFSDITTESLGEGRGRYVVVRPH